MQTGQSITISSFLRMPRLALGGLALAILTLGVAGLVGAVRRLPTTIPNDFHMYYVEGWVVNHDMPLYREEYMAYAAGQIGVASIGYGYPPFFAGLMRAVAVLPLDVASWAWLVGNVLCVLLTVWMLARYFHLSRRVFFLLCGLALLMPAVYDTFLFGQINLWLTLLVAGALILGSKETKARNTQIAAGILMGLAIAVKVYPALLLLVFVMYRKYTALLATALTVLVTFAAGVLYGGGWDATFRYWSVVVPAQSVLVTFPADQSAAAVFARLFQTSYLTVQLAPEQTVYLTVEPWINQPALGRVLWYAFEALVVGGTAFTLWKIRKFSDREGFVLSTALVLTAMLLVLPHVWDHYLAHLLIPLVLLAGYARVWLKKWEYVLLLQAALLFLLLQRYWVLLLRFMESPWLMLFGFVGALLVWVALLILCVRHLPPSATMSFTFSKR